MWRPRCIVWVASAGMDLHEDHLPATAMALVHIFPMSSA